MKVTARLASIVFCLMCFGFQIQAQVQTGLAHHMAGPESKTKAKEIAINRTIRAEIAKAIQAYGKAIDGPDGNLDPLLERVKGKKLVGLGEGTHGTSEVQRLFGNLILSMAKDSRGKVLVFLEEASLPVGPLNHWITGEGQEGDLRRIMGGLLLIHRTTEYEEFFQAARKQNAAAPKGAGIELYGVDTKVEGASQNPIGVLKSFLAANGAVPDADLATAGDFLRKKAADRSPEDRIEFQASTARIHLAVSRVDRSAQGQSEASVWANGLVKLAETKGLYAGVFADLLVKGTTDQVLNIARGGIRDEGMAENMKILMDGKLREGDRAVFWAHIAHVGRFMGMDEAFVAGIPGSWGNTGSILNAWLGDAYAHIGALTGAGTVRAMPVKKGKVGEFKAISVSPHTLSPDCLNAIAASVTRKPIVFEVKRIPFMGFLRPEWEVSAFLSDPPESNTVMTVPNMAADAFVSFPVSTAAHELQ